MELLKLSPAGSEGETAYEITAPPPLVGVLGAMAAPFVYTAGLVA